MNRETETGNEPSNVYTEGTVKLINTSSHFRQLSEESTIRNPGNHNRADSQPSTIFPIATALPELTPYKSHGSSSSFLNRPRTRDGSEQSSSLFRAFTAVISPQRNEQSPPVTSPRRSISLRTLTDTRSSPQHKGRTPSVSSVLRKAIPESPERQSRAISGKPSFFTALSKRGRGEGEEIVVAAVAHTSRPSTSHTSSTMTMVAFRAAPPGRPPGTSQSSYSFGGSEKTAASTPATSIQPTSSAGAMSLQNPYQHILDTASKRISTLDYLRKAHEGRVYWFNTLLISKNSLNSFPSLTSSKLARRAANLLLLGYSLPTILDLNSQSAHDYLKALNALLTEFEQYQNAHPADGDGKGSSSLSRGRLPQMFKRAVAGGGATGKNRRTSGANDAAGFFGTSQGGVGSGEPSPGGSLSFAAASGMGGGTFAGIDSSDSGYAYLLTPSLPFDPDFFETFATLCDVLIDCYTRITQLVSAPDQIEVGFSELFTKADAKVRKLLIANMVKEFEDKSREGVKSEVGGVMRVVLGGLM